MTDCLVDDPCVCWDQIMDWSIVFLKGKGLKSILCKLCLAATVYHVWKHRNDLCHGNSPRSEDLIISQIRWEVRMRILHFGKV